MRSGLSCLLLAASFSFCQRLNAYEAPLAAKSLHEALVLGQRNDQETAGFLAPYIIQTTEQAAGSPRITQIEILTPFAQVVRESQRNLSGYTKEQADKNYRQRGDVLIVRATLLLPAAYPGNAAPPAGPWASAEQKQALRPEEFWKNFRFSVKQQGRTIAARAIRSEPVYTAATKDTPSVLDGVMVQLEYDAKDVASEGTVVEVAGPEGKIVTASFDLKRLR